MKTWKKKGALLSLAGALLSGKTVYADSYPSSYQSWDAVGIVKTVFICSAVVVLGLLGFAIYRVVKEKSLSSKKKKLGFSLLALLSIIIVGANYAVNMFVNVIDTYFAPSYADAAKVADAEEV
ncbi:TPA: beta-glucosidase, partial [Streptococcus suis]|nr:beta-glucosidase [Streptococcus suis]